MAGSLKVGPSLNTLVSSKKMTLSPDPRSKATVKTKKKVSQLKFAFGEFYLSLILLQNYQVYNKYKMAESWTSFAAPYTVGCSRFVCHLLPRLFGRLGTHCTMEAQKDFRLQSENHSLCSVKALQMVSLHQYLVLFYIFYVRSASHFSLWSQEFRAWSHNITLFNVLTTSPHYCYPYVQKCT